MHPARSIRRPPTAFFDRREDIAAFWAEVAASPAQDATLEVLRIERLSPDAFVEIQKYDVFDADGARLFGGLMPRCCGARSRVAG